MALNTGLKLLFITLLKLLQHTSAIDIQNVTSTGMIVSHYAYSGVVTVKFQDVWGYVCYYGSKKRWGKREATTACKQLGYTGGWPMMRNEIESSTHNLYNFDCDEYLEDLNRCEFDVITDCERSVIAGIQCYNSFEVKLKGGKTPNIGRVQVEYDDVVSDVCYSWEDSIPWESHNTLVLCRELGYPGAMFDMGDSDQEMGQSTISGYECNTDKDKSLQDCYPDLPFNNSESCTGIIAACAMPGYVGCFNNNNNPSEPQTSVKLVNMTINECRHYCRESVYRYAFLSRGDTCACSADVTGNTIGDKLCNLRCFGDSDQACGGNSTVSVYDVTKGICKDPWDWKRTYFFGELLIPECRGKQASNLNPVQCVVSKSGKCTWNSTEVLECSDISDNDKGAKDSGLKKPMLIIVGAVIFIGCCALLIYGARIQRLGEHNGKSTHKPNDRCTEDIETSCRIENHDDREKKPDGYYKELCNEFTADVADIKANVSAFFSSNYPKRAEKIIPIENHFGQAKKPDNQPHKDHIYRNRKFYKQKKKHKSEYTRVPDIDPEIFCKHNEDQNASGTDVDAVKSKAGDGKGDHIKRSQNTSEDQEDAVSFYFMHS